MEFLMLLLLIVLFVVLGYCTGEAVGQETRDAQWQQRLIAAKLAHWAVDPVTGETEFVLHEGK